MRSLPVVSLFSGAGGLDLGLENVGFVPRIAVDISPAAIATYRHNRPGTNVVCLDLAAVDPLKLVELWTKAVGRTSPIGVVGGPPCQAFSLSNVQQRPDDPRLLLLDRYADIIVRFAQNLSLSFFLFENVPGLLSERHRPRYEAFKRKCRRAGFVIHEGLIDASSFGCWPAPQLPAIYK